MQEYMILKKDYMREFINMMMQKIELTDEDKEKCIPTTHKIVELAEQCRRQGYLCFEESAKQEEDIFLKTALELLADGESHRDVEQVLQSLILSENYSGPQLLCNLLIAEGIFNIWYGVNPRIIMLKLSAMLGEKYVTRLKGEEQERRKELMRCYRFLGKLEDSEGLPESLPFEEKLSQYGLLCLQRILRDTRLGTLAFALHGCGKKTIRFILNNVSTNNFIFLCGNLKDYNYPKLMQYQKDSILRDQEKIISIIKHLESMGEIVSRSDL